MSAETKKIPKYFRILSIDGGGMRGLIAVYVLAALEDKLQARADAPVSLADYFDLIVGTSTGAIIGSALLLPNRHGVTRYTAREIIDLYIAQGNEIFQTSLWQSIKSFKGMIEAKFSDAGIRRVLKKHFKDLTLKDLIKPCMFTAYDLAEGQIFFFRQHRARHQAHNNFLVRDVVRACTAAPVLFPVANIRSKVNRIYHLIDGGVYAFNPTLCAYAEARRLFPLIRANNMLMLSVSGGCGTGLGASTEQFQDWGAWDWIKVIQHIAFSGQAGVADYELQQLFLTCEETGQYLRLSPETRSDIIEADSVDEKDIVRMQEIAARLVKQNERLIEHFADLLCARTASEQPPWVQAPHSN